MTYWEEVGAIVGSVAALGFFGTMFFTDAMPIVGPILGAAEGAAVAFFPALLWVAFTRAASRNLYSMFYRDDQQRRR